ncbi:MAG: hypothetical protein ACNA8O_10675, partial [Cyanobacteriota bacterium]
GWAVRMLPDLPGSWEQCPPTLLDAAVRDRRWAQGNVQHLGVVSARGLRWPSRAHMLMGVMNYLTSPLWLAMVVIGLVLSARFEGQLAELTFDSERMMAIFVVTMTLLLQDDDGSAQAGGWAWFRRDGRQKLLAAVSLDRV